MNIAIQTCGVAILVILLLFYVRKRKLELRTKQIFKFIYIAFVSCLLLDICSVLSIQSYEKIALIVIKIICKCYLASLLICVLLVLIYICSDLNVSDMGWKKRVWGYSSLTVMMILLVFALPISIHYDAVANEVYTEGFAVLLTYAGALTLIVTILVILLVHKDMNPRRRRAICIWMLMWIGAAALQFFFNELLVVGFAAALGIVVVYIQFENPELNLDRETGVFNHSAFLQYIQQVYHKKSEMAALSVRLNRYGANNRYAELETQMIVEIGQLLAKDRYLYVFRMTEKEYLILLKDKTFVEEYVKSIRWQISSVIRKYEALTVIPLYVYLDNIQIVENGKYLTELMQYAGAKNEGQMKETLVTVNEEVAQALFHRKIVEQKMSEALEHHRVCVYYQPIYSLQKRRFVSAEALVRMFNEDGELMSPMEFIPIAEENGMIHKIGTYVFESVCRFFVEQKLEQKGIEYIEINLSTLQCAKEDLAKEYLQIMKRCEIQPKHINLEITESASTGAKKILLDNMNTLIEKGVSFSLDDFGTGQSNLNYIVEMPVEIVKFDRQMINAYFENRKAKYVMDAAMHMIDGLGLSIVAEGIETEEQVATMAELGIQYIQGYYFSKPLPEKEFLAFITEKNM